FSLSTQNRRVCKLGKKRRRVLLFACDTLLPVAGRLPVTWHTRAMAIPLKYLSGSVKPAILREYGSKIKRGPVPGDRTTMKAGRKGPASWSAAGRCRFATG